MNSTPLSERVQIGFFGRRNAGKSSVVNAVTGQELCVVSSFKGTTTDPVLKTMELLPIGPVAVIDTAGFDDEGELGLLRIEKTKSVLNRVDIAVLVVDAQIGLMKVENELISLFKEKNIKYIIAYNKSDLLSETIPLKGNEIYISALKKSNIYELKELIASIYEEKENPICLVKDLVNKYSKVILVTPIDSAAPKGRLILPQQQVLRELLDIGAVTAVVKETEFEEALKLVEPELVITDSQVFKKVDALTPKDVPLTSFSILFARYKGVLNYAVKGVNAIAELKDNDTILISEGCTHHRQCDDIGTVKLPNWLRNYTNKKLNFEFSSGSGFPSDLSKYSMIIHCGACMLKDREVLYRYKQAEKQGIPISNYGITIAFLHNILKRSVYIFRDIYSILK